MPPKNNLGGMLTIQQLMRQNYSKNDIKKYKKLTKQTNKICNRIPRGIRRSISFTHTRQQCSMEMTAKDEGDNVDSVD